MTRPAWLLGVAILIAACGASRSTGERHAPSQSRDIVLGDELERYSGGNLHDALRALRPEWFAASPLNDGPVVYVDSRRFGGIRSLSLILLASVVSVRFYSASEAHGRFGPGHLYGAIEVTTGPPPLEP
jgi:hypothetical protein